MSFVIVPVVIPQIKGWISWLTINFKSFIKNQMYNWHFNQEKLFLHTYFIFRGFTWFHE